MRKTFFILSVCMLSACRALASTPAPPAPSFLVVSTSLPREMISPVPTWRALLPPSPTPTPVRPTVTPTLFLSATPTGPACLNLIEPADGASFYKDQDVTLRWEELPEVTTYIVLLKYPDGLQEKLQAPGPEMILNLNAGQAAASYTWSVQAYDPDNRLICSSNILTFEILPVSAPTLTETPLASPAVDQTQSPVP